MEASQEDAGSEQAQVGLEERIGLGYVHFGLVELPMLILQQQQQIYVDEGQREQGHRRPHLILLVDLHEEGNVARGQQYRIHRHQLHYLLLY